MDTGTTGGAGLGSHTTVSVTALGSGKILGYNGGRFLVVSKELCYGKAETLEDAEGAARWCWYNLAG